jgi:hypothetical protein
VSRYREIDLNKVRTIPILQRLGKVSIDSLAKASGDLADAIPDILQGREFKEFIQICRQAIANGKPLILALGGHVIKCGLAPLVIELMRAGAVRCIAVNGAVTIHDYELAYFGSTSENVASGLADGSFGMAAETSSGINSIISRASAEGLGYGEALGKDISENAPREDISLLGTAYKLGIPVTAHIAIGTDIIHQTADADGKAIGDCSLRDFRIFCEQVRGLDNGGVFINIGSSVILPEVFLKALTVARNTQGRIQDFTTAVFDVNMHYRCMENVVKRPVENGGKGFYFIGHHEIMIPLWIRQILE